MNDFLEYTYNRILEVQDQMEVDEANFKNSDENEGKSYRDSEEYKDSINEITNLRTLIRSYNLNKGEIYYD